MSTDAFRYKKPFSPDAEVTEAIEAWQTLDLSADTELQAGQTNALNLRRPPQVTAASAESLAEPEFKPLTADDMEQLRQAAYDEGFAEGKEEGFGKGYQEGREQGLLDGTAQGMAEGKKQAFSDVQPEIEAKLSQVSQLLEQLQQPLAGLNKQVELALTELALAMAKAVIGVEVKTNPTIVLQALHEATAALPLNTEHMLIKLHPDDLTVIREHYSDSELQQRHWQLRAEPLVERGGCLVESEKSSVDRSLTQRLQSSLEHFLHQSIAE
ncbi:flagellar assembly protein FliH [Alishewanella longhuensis]|uniref:Flagellar assembly protein FliH n=1 Tax=Alishewanella longhuensis TaxID=1091037 RepID=A0ABQ3KYD1_9ALTE|nr:flagellar assembly protein FliH [Alishewanella longhuensis]GHG69476.1 flagellar assembly protein FliH [Alishewanella longhuensis]